MQFMGMEWWLRVTSSRPATQLKRRVEGGELCVLILVDPVKHRVMITLVLNGFWCRRFSIGRASCHDAKGASMTS